MSERPTHSSAPIDAEFEPAEDGETAKNGQDKPARRKGPGWMSFLLVMLIALGALGLSLWSSGLLERTGAAESAGTSLEDLQSEQATLQQRVGEMSAQLEGLIDRVDAEVARLDSDIAAGAEESPGPAAPEEVPDGLAARLEGLEEQVANLTEAEDNAVDPARIDAIETALKNARNGGGASDEQLVSLRTELETLRSELETFKAVQRDYASDLATLRTDTAELSQAAASVVSASLALSAIEAAANRGETFEAEYTRLREARPGDAGIETLASLSRIEVPTLSTLKSDFRSLRTSAIARDTEESSGLGWVNTVFGESVSVRRTNPDSTTAERLADAQAALARDDLRVAIDAVEALPESAGAVFQTWLADARRRARLEQSLEDLRLKLIASAQ